VRRTHLAEHAVRHGDAAAMRVAVVGGGRRGNQGAHDKDEPQGRRHRSAMKATRRRLQLDHLL
jgi:hypothetical protein